MRIDLVVIVFAVLAVSSGEALADCRCAANGTLYEQGQTACIALSGGRYLARCGKVLNNSSWEKLQDGCPLSEAPAVPVPDATSDHQARTQTAG